MGSPKHSEIQAAVSTVFSGNSSKSYSSDSFSGLSIDGRPIRNNVYIRSRRQIEGFARLDCKALSRFTVSPAARPSPDNTTKSRRARSSLEVHFTPSCKRKNSIQTPRSENEPMAAYLKVR
jgi:hypothetical protein